MMNPTEIIPFVVLGLILLAVVWRPCRPVDPYAPFIVHAADPQQARKLVLAGLVDAPMVRGTMVEFLSPGVYRVTVSCDEWSP